MKKYLRIFHLGKYNKENQLEIIYLSGNKHL